MSFTSTPPATIRGEVLDTQPTRLAGAVIIFPNCQHGACGKLLIGTISVYNASGGPTVLAVKRHGQPTNSSYSCPLFFRCDDPLPSRSCMGFARGSSCHMQDPTPSSSDLAVFTAGLNSNTQETLRASELVVEMRIRYGVPINFIPSPGEQSIALNLSGTVAAALHQLAAGDSHYLYERANGRIVVYPRADSTKYHQRAQLPVGQFEGLNRYDMGKAYVHWLNTHVAGFERLVEPPFAGNPAGLPYLERVTLAKRATVLEHLTQILGSDSTIAFSIRTAPTGLPFLNFEDVATPIVPRAAIRTRGGAGKARPGQ